MSSASSPHSTSEVVYSVGDVIAGKYRLEALLGQGGMGAVFQARNTVLDMPVAIKLIRADLSRELFGGRLLQEARAAAKLQHPAIVRVFDVGQTALGAPFIVMELLEGESLSELIDRDGRLTAISAVRLLLPIADALSAAHAKGFVHRDVKPDNVFVVMDQGLLQPKLVDFGIVKTRSHEGQHQLTQVGAVMGSPDYMSPEQARGLDDIDQRADVWSFSVMLYEAIAGKTPFEHENYNALLRLIVEQEPASLSQLAAADEELSRIVARGMSKDRTARYPSLGQMGKALAAWLVEQGITDDACGVSLESKWLTRQTDPLSAAARASRSSTPELFETSSGVRQVGRRFQVATTVAVESTMPSTHTAPPAAPSGRHAWLAVGVVALLVLPAAWFAFRHAERPGSNGSASGELTAATTGHAALPSSRRIPQAPSLGASVPPPSPAPASAVPSSAQPPEPAGAPAGAASAPKKAAVVKKAGPRAVTRTGRPPTKTDLLAPY